MSAILMLYGLWNIYRRHTYTYTHILHIYTSKRTFKTPKFAYAHTYVCSFYSSKPFPFLISINYQFFSANARGEVYVWGKNEYTRPKGKIEGILGPTGVNAPFIEVVFSFFFLSFHFFSFLSFFPISIFYKPFSLSPSPSSLPPLSFSPPFSLSPFQLPTKVPPFGREGKVRAMKVQASSYQNLVLGDDKKAYSWGCSGSSFLLGLRMFFIYLFIYFSLPSSFPSIFFLFSLTLNFKMIHHIYYSFITFNYT